MNLKLNLKLNKNYNVGFILTVLFFVLIFGEAYIAYFWIYRNLNSAEGVAATNNAVRVNLNQYGDSIKLLDSYEAYYPAPNIIEKNPFK